MWNEFGNTLSDKLFLQAIKWASIITDKYAAIIHSKRTQAIIASLLLLTGEAQNNTLWEISSKISEDVSDWEVSI